MKKQIQFSVLGFAILSLCAIGSNLQASDDTENRAPTKSEEQASFAEYNAIIAALKPYIDGAKTGDGAFIRSNFFPHARIVGSVHGEMEKSTPDEFEAVIDGLGAAPGLKHHIAWIDISGPAAAAKVEFQDWGGFRFTDFFVLYKVDGEWKVSGEVYDAHSNN